MAAREAFMRNFFTKNPTKGVREANEALDKDQKGGKMGLARAYAIEREIKGVNCEKVQGLILAAAQSTGTVAPVTPAVIVPPAPDASAMLASLRAEYEGKLAALAGEKLGVGVALTGAQARVGELEQNVATLNAQNAALLAECNDLRAKLAATPAPAPKAEKVTPLRERILNALTAGPMTGVELAQALQTAGATLRGRTSEMVKEGSLVKADGKFALAPAKVEAPAAPVAEPTPAVAANG